jgi:hypothetical protein
MSTKNIQSGGCRCGAARYEIDLTGAAGLVCHCLDCQKHLGAPYSVFTMVPASQFRWLAEPEGSIQFSGAAVRRFCNKCGTYLKWEGTGYEHEAEINAMTLENPGALKLTEEIYTRTRLPWVRPVEGAAQFEASRED